MGGPAFVMLSPTNVKFHKTLDPFPREPWLPSTVFYLEVQSAALLNFEGRLIGVLYSVYGVLGCVHELYHWKCTNVKGYLQ